MALEPDQNPKSWPNRLDVGVAIATGESAVRYMDPFEAREAMDGVADAHRQPAPPRAR